MWITVSTRFDRMTKTYISITFHTVIFGFRVFAEDTSTPLIGLGRTESCCPELAITYGHRLEISLQELLLGLFI